MALSSGDRLGSYEIVSALGAGGMGEVYRARDLKLGRNVALKVLLPAVASVPDRLSRFDREAKTLASLNHPNIAQIYGLEDGQSGAVLVLELVEGPTLADRLATGPISLDQTLNIAAQIADAIDAAHELGIIHRDLKPANVKVRPDGVVKVLDFGLAKVLEPSESQRELSQSPTMTSPAMTNAGVILGTAAYMSPEQARGQIVDRRADVWAFGCVLYEMLTRRQPFIGHTVTDVIAAIIEREPDWRQLPSTTPVAVRRLLRRCLTKDLRKRLHDMADARLEIEDALAHVNDAPDSVPVVARSPGWKAWPVVLASAAIAAVAVTWLGFQRTRSTATDGSPPDATIERLTFDSGVTRMPALSSDGRLLAYASDRAGNGDLDIWVQQMSGGTPLRLTDDPGDDSAPDFSPDGSQLAFRSERNGGGIYLVPTLGGPARLIAAEGRRPRFSPDGSRVAYWTGQFRGSAASQDSSLYVVDLSGGTPARLLSDFDVAKDPVWTGDGRSLIVSARRQNHSSVSDAFDWWMVPVDGKPPVKTRMFETALLRGVDLGPSRWTADGVLFSFRDDLWKVTVSNEGRVDRPPRRLTLGVGPYVDPTTGPNGEIVFARLVAQRAIERASLSNTAEPAVRLYSDSATTAWRASGTPDGSTIVLEREVGSFREIWIKKTSTGHQELVTRVSSEAQVNATISNDGSRIAYTQGDTQMSGFSGTGYVVEASGGVPRKVCEACELHGFLADNKRVLAQLGDGHAIRVIDSTTGAAHDVVVAENGSRLDRPHASPDDRLLAFRRARGGMSKTFVVPLTSDRPLTAESANAIDEPTITGRPCGWSLDSRTVYLLLDTDGFRCLWGQQVDPARGAPVGKPTAARHFHSTAGMSTSFGNAITSGGFLYEAQNETANLWKLQPTRQR
jgi:dipeptidyl aminopeptidase/acylaminoacyl peptidase